MEPLRGFLGRFLRQRLLAIEARSKVQDNQMMAVVEWLVKVHAHLVRQLFISFGCFLEFSTLDFFFRTRSWNPILVAVTTH